MKPPAAIRSPRRIYRRWRRENGNIMVISALLMTAMIGMLALTIDIGFLAGQRRFMQNGADAAALAAVRVLSNSVSQRQFSSAPGTGTFLTYFGASDATVRAKALEYAQANQNVGLAVRTTNFQVTLWYCVADTPTDYSGADCTDNDLDNDPNNDAGSDWVLSPGQLPVQSANDGTVPIGAYMVRVRVSSTITTLFGPAAGMAANTSTSAVAVAMIIGACPPGGIGKTWPFTVKDQPQWQFGAGFNNLYKLWDPSPPGGGSWKQILDFSPAVEWCDNDSLDYVWGNPSPTTLVPANTPQGTYCARPAPLPSPNNVSFTGTDGSWNRGAYQQDPRTSSGSCNWQGTGDAAVDVQNWAAGSFNGNLAVNMWLPTYKGGSLGANIGDAIYGSSSGNAISNCTGTQYFFSTPDGVDTEHSPSWGRYRYVQIFTYDTKQIWKTNGTPGWDTCPGNSPCAGGAPERVKLVALYTFRIYEKPPNGSCGSGGTVTSSTICGRLESPVYPPTTTPGCNGSTRPSVFGNIVRMGR